MKRVPRGYWENKENVDRAALSCKTRNEFRLNYAGAWEQARQNGYLSSYTHFEEKCKPKGYWNKENSHNVAMLCTSISEFHKKYPMAYKFALDNDLLDVWFVRKQVKAHYWDDKERNMAEARKYETRTEFCRNNPNAYQKALEFGYIDEYDFFKRDIGIDYKGEIDCVYVYHFEEMNSVYIGRTIDPKQRDKDHIYATNKDAVAKFAHKHNISVPKMVILEENITLEQGLMLEEFYVKKYKSAGYNIINKAKCGVGSGSLGGMNRQWNYTAVKRVASKCKTKKEFKEKYPSASSIAFCKGWMKDFDWLQNGWEIYRKWNYETCYKAFLSCKSRTEFAKKYGNAYKKSKKNGWLDNWMK